MPPDHCTVNGHDWLGNYQDQSVECRNCFARGEEYPPAMLPKGYPAPADQVNKAVYNPPVDRGNGPGED